MRMMAVFEKDIRIRHIGHLDIQRAVQRGLRRSGLPVAYSNGFNPHILVTFASALATGAYGKREIMDVTLAEPVSENEFLHRMNAAMPPELKLIQARGIGDKHDAMMAMLKAASYEIKVYDKAIAERLIGAIPGLLEMKSVQAIRKTKTGLKECDIRPMIYSISGSEDRIFATLALTERETCKPDMLIKALAAACGSDEPVRTLVCRNALLGEDEKGMLVPLERL